MKKVLLLFFFIVAVGTYTRVCAQIGSPTPTATMGVQITQVLDLQVTAGSALTFNFNTIALLDAGIPLTNATTLTYRSNQPWYINIAANSATFSEAANGNPTPMPASVIQYRMNGTSTYTTLTTTATSLDGTTGSKNARGKGTVGVDFFLNPGYIYAPATDYSMTITYTITTL